MGFSIDGSKLVKYEEEPGVFEIKIPDGVKSFDYGAFDKCTSIRKIEFPGTVKEIKDLFLYTCTSLEEIVVNEGTELIDWFVFWRTWQAAPIKKVTVPDSCRCTSRKSRGNEQFCIEDGIVYTTDKKRIIYCLSGVEDEYHMPETVEDIEPYAFSHSSRKAIFVPESVELPKDAFFDLRDFSNYVKIKDALRISFQSKGKIVAYYSEYMKISKVSGTDIAYVVVFQSGKGWDAAVNEKVTADNSLVPSLFLYSQPTPPD